MEQSFSIPENIETPFYLYNLKRLRNKIAVIKNAFESYENFELFYAVKANNNPTILKEIINNGLGLHVSSPEELKLAISLRCKKISYHSPIVTKDILKLKKVYDFEININNKADLKLFPKNSKGTGARINPLIGWAETPSAKAAGKHSQFGIPINELDQKTIESVTRLHCHTSSDSFKQSIFIKQLNSLLGIAQKNKNITTINIGGGIGVPIWKDEKEFEIKKFAKKIITILNNFNRKNSSQIKLQLEIGNYLVRESGCYVCEVVQTEKKFERTHIFTNGTKHHLKGLLPDRATFLTKNKNLHMASIIGCTCQRGDILLENKKIPILKNGDLIVFENAGAYCCVQADNFHLLPKPKEYFN